MSFKIEITVERKSAVMVIDGVSINIEHNGRGSGTMEVKLPSVDISDQDTLGSMIASVLFSKICGIIPAASECDFKVWEKLEDHIADEIWAFCF